MRIKSETFIRVEGWMVNELGLKGSTLLLYALIWGFTKDGGQFNGSRPYIAEWLGCTTTSVDKYVRQLTNAGLIVKDQLTINGMIRNQYRICHEKVKAAAGQENERGSQNIDLYPSNGLTGGGESFGGGSQDFSPNTYSYKEDHTKKDSFRADGKKKGRNGGAGKEKLYQSNEWDEFFKAALRKSMGDDVTEEV